MVKDRIRENAPGGTIAIAPIAAWLAQRYGVPMEVIAPLLTWAGVWLRGLVKG